jgi:hypothetical protein
MTQPKFAPIAIEDEVRPAYHLGPPRPWVANRPADFRAGPPLSGPGTGTAGPDQGFALLLAGRLSERLVLAPGERLGDVELALAVFGYLSPAPDELVEFRRGLFAGVSHDYWAQRELANRVPSSTLRRKATEIDVSGSGWRALIGA